MADRTPITPGTQASKISSGSQSVNTTIPIEYYVINEETMYCSLCTCNLFISCILFTCDIIFESFILIQWLHNEYYIPILILLIFIFISNIGNIYQWYIQFNDYTTFKLCHLIIPFGLIGLLPFFSIIYYLCHSSCCICARIGRFSNEYYSNSISPSKHNKMISNDVSARLLQPRSNSISDINTKHHHIYHELFTNITQLLCLQSFLRTLPFVCLQLFVFVTTKFEEHNWILTHWNIKINISIPNELLINDLNISYYMSISIALLTYAFITLTCLDIMEQWQHDFPNIMNGFLKLLHVLFIFCDCIIRIMPIILILQCKDTISWYYIVFGAQFMLYLEIVIWYEIYQYYPDFPMRKIYPFTYNALYNKCNDMPIISTPIPISHIAMQSQTKQTNKNGHLSIERSDHSSQKQYENPRYISNGSNGLNNDTSNAIILSPVSASSDEINQTYMAGMSEEIETKYDEEIDINNDKKVWVHKKVLEPTWKIEKDEYISGLQGLFGGILTCISGWLIGYTLRHCNIQRQYNICIVELMLRYVLSIGLIFGYANEYHKQIFKNEEIDSNYWIWIVIFVGCILCNIAYICIIHLIFKPNVRRMRLNDRLKN